MIFSTFVTHIELLLHTRDVGVGHIGSVEVFGRFSEENAHITGDTYNW